MKSPDICAYKKIISLRSPNSRGPGDSTKLCILGEGELGAKEYWGWGVKCVIHKRREQVV